MGEALRERLARLVDHPHVAEVRGLGLMPAVELVQDRDTLERFPASEHMAQRVVAAGLQEGVFFYPVGSGPAQDVIGLSLPFIISEAEIDELIGVLEESVDSAVDRVGHRPGSQDP